MAGSTPADNPMPSNSFTYGETGEFTFNIVRDTLHIHNLNAAILHCLGINRERPTYRYQGRDFRLTDVHGQVTKHNPGVMPEPGWVALP